MSTILYIAGMHRSGTSALSRLMHTLGFEIPGELDTNTFHNATGHWEPVAFVGLNTLALQHWGSDWCELRLPETHPAQPLDPGLADAFESYLTEACSPAGDYVLKDPRVCYTLEHWLTVTRRQGQVPLVVVPVRHPLEVAQSLAARDAMPLDAALALWLCSMLSAEYASRSAPRCAVEYDALLADWRSAYAPIAALTDTTVPVAGSPAGDRVDAAIVRDQRHHTAPRTEPAADAPLVHRLAAEAYRLFGQQLDGAGSHAAFDDLRRRAAACIVADGLVADAQRFGVEYRAQRAIAERDAIIIGLHDEIAANHRQAQAFIDNREVEYRAQYTELERKLHQQLDEAAASAQAASEWYTAQNAAASAEIAWLSSVVAAQAHENSQLQAIIAEQAPYVRILRTLHFWRRR